VGSIFILLTGTLFGALNYHQSDVSASKSYCAESKDGSQANPGCMRDQSKKDCKDSTTKDFKCVKQPERPPDCELIGAC
ncbi:MAG: hypothetical protein ACRD8W_19125, partial [Nitrososphaeraceae archaeon]